MFALKAFIENSDDPQIRWAKRFEISASYLSELLTGKKTPSVGLIRRIETATGGEVLPTHWFEAAE